MSEINIGLEPEGGFLRLTEFRHYLELILVKPGEVLIADLSLEQAKMLAINLNHAIRSMEEKRQD